MEQEYTYQELVAIGKGKTPPSPDLRYSKGHQIPVESNNGEVVWIDNPTAEQIAKWKLMVYGMYYAIAEKSRMGNNLQAFANIPAGRMAGTIMMPFPETSNKGKQSEAGVAQETWGLDRNFPLISTAALFYLLYTRHAREDKAASMELQYLCDSILPDIKNYLDMATGGEARHMAARGYPYEAGRATKEIEEEAFNSGFVEVNKKGNLELYGKDKHRITDISGSSRHYAWDRWHAIREELGIIALDWCILVHMTTLSGGYGGPYWASAALLIREYELGRKSDIFFIDQAFSLQHNGGIIFNKLWNVNGLQQVLDLAFQGKVYDLPQYLNEEHAEIYKRVCHEVTKYDMDRREGHLELRKVLTNPKESAVLSLKEDYTVAV